MKSAVYTKAGQVGIEEIKRPSFKRQMMPLFVLSVLAFVVPTYGTTAILILKQVIKIVATKLLGSWKKSEKLLQRLSQETLSLRLSPMVVGSVTPVVLAMMGRVTAILGTNWSGGVQAEYIRFHFANWALVKIPGQPSDYTEGMLKSLLTLADVMPTGYQCSACS